ncbi:unnamed protein product, partial [Mesorhabditis spiculigera]
MLLQLGALLLLLLGCSYAADPVADKVTSLPGLSFKIDYGVWSGYLNAGNNGTWKMHYWLVESKSNPKTDPILVWFNGGPGCSSFGGMFEELGPFYVSQDGKTLFENKFSWNQKANVLALESPIGVGFSYDSSNLNYSTANDVQSMNQNFAALNDFFKSFPDYANRDFYLSGESYAGIYIPMLSAVLAEGIVAKTFVNPNFQGAAIGNGYMHIQKLYNSLVLWSAYHGRVSPQEWEYVKTTCNAGATRPNDPDTYNYFNYLKTTTYLDFASDNSTCGDIIYRMTSVPRSSDPYNYYQDCFASKYADGYTGASASRPAHPAQMKRIRRKREAAQPGVKADVTNLAAGFNYDSSDPYQGYACYGSPYIWANTQEVQKALNIADDWQKGGMKWQDCSDPIYQQYTVTYNDQTQFFERFFKANTNTKFRFLVYNGDVDTVCNYLGDAWFIADYAAAHAIKADDRIDWYFAGQTAGYSQRYNDNSGVTIDVVTVKGAGHFVPTDRPGAARQMITNFMFPSQANGRPDYNSTANVDPYPTLAPILNGGQSTVSPVPTTSSTIQLSYFAPLLLSIFCVLKNIL